MDAVVTTAVNIAVQITFNSIRKTVVGHSKNAPIDQERLPGIERNIVSVAYQNLVSSLCLWAYIPTSVLYPSYYDVSRRLWCIPTIVVYSNYYYCGVLQMPWCGPDAMACPRCRGMSQLLWCVLDAVVCRLSKRVTFVKVFTAFADMFSRYYRDPPSPVFLEAQPWDNPRHTHDLTGPF